MAIIGFAWFKEPVTFAKVAFIGLTLVGVVGLNLVLEDQVR